MKPLWLAEPRYRTTDYALKPGLTLIPTSQGGLLLSLRPMLVVKLNAQAFRLLSQLATVNPPQQGVPTPISSAAELAFLDYLVGRRLLVRKPPAIRDWPMVSIIMPAHGRPEATRVCINSLLALDYPPHRREIIVIDDASDPPLELADLPIRVLRQSQNIGQSAARNRGALAAQGQLLAFIDNDCVAKSDWLKTLVPYFSDPAVGIVGGRVIAPPAQGIVATFETTRSPLDMGTVAGEVGPEQAIAYLPTCNLLVRRHLLLTQGGFDDTLRVGEDVDFIWRVLADGARAYYAPEGQIIHHHRIRLMALLRRRADYG